MSGIDMAPLIELLEKQKIVCEKLLALSYEKRQVIINGDTERLGEIVQEELRYLARVNLLEKKRAVILGEIAVALGVKTQGLTLTLISEAAAGEEKDSLIKLQKEFMACLRAQSEMNSDNQQLLEAQLEYTDTMLNMFVGAEDPLNNFYGTGGRTGEDRKQSTGVYDWQV